MSNLKYSTILLILTLSALSSEKPVAQQLFEEYSPRPFAHALLVNEPPVVDGDLSDHAYSRTQPLLGFNSRFLHAPVSQQTELRVVWTEQGLFAAARCLENKARVYHDGLRYYLDLERRYGQEKVFRFVEGKFFP